MINSDMALQWFLFAEKLAPVFWGYQRFFFFLGGKGEISKNNDHWSMVWSMKRDGGQGRLN